MIYFYYDVVTFFVFLFFVLYVCVTFVVMPLYARVFFLRLFFSPPSFPSFVGVQFHAHVLMEQPLVGRTVQFSSVPQLWEIDRRFSRDPLPVFSATGRRDKF